jgi:hypothetical protein
MTTLTRREAADIGAAVGVAGALLVCPASR